MRKIVKSHEAEEDLIGLWSYSCEKWGEVQADRYLDEIEAALIVLARNPQLGKSIDDVRAGYRCLPVNKHSIYYRIKGNLIDVVRVLHQRMDIPHRLPEQKPT